MAAVLLGLGSNIPPARENISRALSALEELGKVEKTAALIISKPEGFLEQADFINTAALLRTDLEPLPLLKKLKELEVRLGRRKTFKNGPRVIDLDILFYDDKIVNLPNLVIPHPAAAAREFVLAPLAEIAPDFIHPVLNKTIKELLAELQNIKPKSSVKKYNN